MLCCPRDMILSPLPITRMLISGLVWVQVATAGDQPYEACALYHSCKAAFASSSPIARDSWRSTTLPRA